MDDLQEQLRLVFRDEAAEAFDDLAHIVDRLRSCRGGTPELEQTLASAFRIAHNIKGSATTVGLDQIATMMHAVEGGLTHFRKRAEPPSEELLRAVLEVIAVVQNVADGREAGATTESMVALVARSYEGTAGSNGALEPAAKPADDKHGVEAGAWAARPAGAQALSMAPAAEEPSPAAAGTATEGDDRAGTVRIPVARIDALMAHAGELLANQARLRHLQEILESFVGGFYEALQSDRMSAAKRKELSAGLQNIVHLGRKGTREFGHLATELSETTRRIRMLPLIGEGPYLRRVTRDSARELGKDVRCDVDTGEIELDKQVVDQLRDPMMHMLRNCVDHGIETPEERSRRGKPKVGQVSITAAVQGPMVQIDVSDDGRGLDIDEIKSAAERSGAVTPDRLARMTPAELRELLFLPGFTTRTEANRLSGRGVGLDVARRRVEALGGNVRIADKPRLGGTTFLLTVPISVVSLSGLLVEAGGAKCILPVASVERCLRVRTSEVRQVDGAAALSFKDAQPVRLRWLGSVLGESRKADSDRLVVVVVSRGGSTLGVVVDAVFGEDEFVVKKLPWNLKRVAGVSGAVVLADGEIGVVVDVAHLVGQATDAHDVSERVQQAPARTTPRLLVVDDSLTSRTLERNLLAAAGYEVTTAENGAEAWKLLQSRPVDLVVTDVQMPLMDGLELTRKIRASSKHKNVPVILVSSLGEPSDLHAGADAGANEYIVKSKFDQRQLLEAVVRLI